MPSNQDNLLVLNRRDAILQLAPVLEGFAALCDQEGAMHWLSYFLDQEVMKLRRPFLVLTLKAESDRQQRLRVDDIGAAALFFEYHFFRIPTGIFATADAVGFNSIVAPRGERGRVAAAAVQALVKRGAAIVLSTYESTGEPEVDVTMARWTGVRWAWRQRQVGRILHLEPTYEASLAKLGKSTRFNLRYYRRRLTKEIGCEYIADAAPLLRDADLRAINANSLNPVDSEEFVRRVQSASELPGSYLSGLRAPDGRWLSLIGGWRQNATTVLYWQMNRLGLEKYSLGTAMRSFYLEDEIARGAKKLLIYGGTSHTMRHAFREEPVADLVVQRRGMRAGALKALARFMGSPRNRFGRPNFLADTLRSPELRWMPASSRKALGRKSWLKSLHSQWLA